MNAKTSAEIGQGAPEKADSSAAPFTREDQAEYWGDLFDKGYLTFDRKRGKLVPIDTYRPDDREPSEVRVKGMIAEKKCRGCGDMLSLDCFSPSRTGRGGVKSRCRECCAEAARQYGRTPAGRAARARAVAKYEAQERARQETIAARARFEQSPAGRKLAAAYCPREEVKNG